VEGLAVSLKDKIVEVVRSLERPERQELWCHDCNNYVQFTLDVSLNGNHVLECPRCGHEHCRVVRDGKITDIRWAQRNGPTWGVSQQAGNVTTSSSSTYSSYSGTASTGAAQYFTYQSWMNTTSSS
jgi:hypothetical protein